METCPIVRYNHTYTSDMAPYINSNLQHLLPETTHYEARSIRHGVQRVHAGDGGDAIEVRKVRRLAKHIQPWPAGRAAPWQHPGAGEGRAPDLAPVTGEGAGN